MAATPDITAGIKAIKIAKEDALSNDISVQLQEAKVLRIAFDDLGIKQFDIISIAEYPTYYLYYVIPQELGILTSTFPTPTALYGTGNGFTNASGEMVFPGTGGSIVYGKKFAGLYTSTNKTNFTFNAAQGTFTSPVLKSPYSFPVSFTCSVFTENSTGNHSFNLGISGSYSGFSLSNFTLSSSNANDIVGYGNQVVTLVAPTSGSSNARTIYGSFNLTINPLTLSEWGLRFNTYYGSTVFHLPTSSIQFNIESYVTSSTDVNGVITVIEPYTSEDVANSEYNALIDNAVQPRPNAFYMDVDYSSNAIVAVNERAILDGNATRATVQYSNYTTARITNPRYYGSKNVSPDINIGYGTLEPVVESDGTYFAYFDWVGGTTPELINKAGFHIKYLIDSNANVYSPNLTGSYYYNLINSFNNNNNKVNVLFQAGETSGNIDNLQGVHSVIRPSAQPRAIIFSQTGSTSNTLPSMSFSSGTVLHNYAGVASLAFDSYVPNATQTVDIASSVVSPTDLTWNTTNNTAGIDSTDSNINIAPKLTANITYLDEDRGYDGIGYVTFQKSTNGGSSWSTYSTHQIILDNGVTATFGVTGPSEPAVSGSLYRARFVFNSAPSSPGSFLNINSGTFSITQDPTYGGTVISGSFTPYWTQHVSSPKNIITGSQFTAAIYGGTQTTVSGSGYDAPYLPFELQIGDEIRFTANENSVYQIIGINEPTSNPQNVLYLTLDKNIVSGTNLQSFFIRRYNPNPNFVIVDALKDSNTGGGPGFLLPEYASLDLTNKFDEIIKTLTEKGLI